MLILAAVTKPFASARSLITARISIGNVLFAANCAMRCMLLPVPEISTTTGNLFNDDSAAVINQPPPHHQHHGVFHPQRTALRQALSMLSVFYRCLAH